MLKLRPRKSKLIEMANEFEALFVKTRDEGRQVSVGSPLALKKLQELCYQGMELAAALKAEAARDESYEPSTFNPAAAE